jgi:hypothetical protein
MNNIDKYLKKIINKNKKVIKANVVEEVVESSVIESNTDTTNDTDAIFSNVMSLVDGDIDGDDWATEDEINEMSNTDYDEDEESYSEPEEGDIVLTNSGSLGSKTSASEVGGKFIGEFNTEDEAINAAKEFFNNQNFHGTIWYEDDHGGIHVVNSSAPVAPMVENNVVEESVIEANTDTSDSYNVSNSTTNNTIQSTTTEEAILSEILSINGSIFEE